MLAEDMSRPIFICGGGTGGHFFSGLAIAEDYLELHPQSQIIFVGTERGIEARVKLEDPRMKVCFIHSRGVLGKGIFSKAAALLSMAYGFFESIALLIRYRPLFILGVGGYASVPTVLAALVLKGGKRVGVIEQNSFPGFANRVFRKLGARALAAFPVAGFQTLKLPIRKYLQAKADGVPVSVWPPRRIFILGGSQGARGLNDSWLATLPQLQEFFPLLEYIHQTGRADEERVRAAYDKLNLRAEVFAFSDQMPKFYEAADLIVSRSGAMTVFEIAAFRRPSIFVPFPAATHQHQLVNAKAVQIPEWIIAESEWSWERLRAVLAADQPQIPARRFPVQTDIQQVFSALST